MGAIKKITAGELFNALPFRFEDLKGLKIAATSVGFLFATLAVAAINNESKADLHTFVWGCMVFLAVVGQMGMLMIKCAYLFHVNKVMQWIQDKYGEVCLESVDAQKFTYMQAIHLFKKTTSLLWLAGSAFYMFVVYVSHANGVVGAFVAFIIFTVLSFFLCISVYEKRGNSSYVIVKAVKRINCATVQTT